MDRYLIRKILKNILICLFACWVLFEIREFSVYGEVKTAAGRRNLENSEFFIGNAAADHRDAEALRKIIGKTEIIGETPSPALVFSVSPSASSTSPAR